MPARLHSRLLAFAPFVIAIAAACGSDDDKQVVRTAEPSAGAGGESEAGAGGAAADRPEAGAPSQAGGGTPSSSGGAAGEAATAGAAGTSDGGAPGLCDETGANDACAPIVAALSGLRWDIPCGVHIGAAACNATDPEPVVATMQGVPEGLYEVTLRFRGVIELESYSPLPESGTWIQDATPANDGNNIYSLAVSDPPATYYLNAGEHLPYCQPLDEEHAVRIRAGATVTLFATAYDGGQVTNVDSDGQPLVVDGVSPAPEPYDGQFVQMDVVDIAKAP